MYKIVSGIIILSLSTLSLPSFALRCAGQIIKVGDPITKVKKFCKKPQHIQPFERQISKGVAITGVNSTTTTAMPTNNGRTVMTQYNNSGYPTNITALRTNNAGTTVGVTANNNGVSTVYNRNNPLTVSNTQAGALTYGESNSKTIYGEKWYMNFGSRQINQVLVFEDGILVKIETGDGYGWQE